MTKATRKEIKEEAQQRLIQAMQAAFDAMSDDGLGREYHDMASKEMARVEKMFGFVPYSFTRGC